MKKIFLCCLLIVVGCAKNNATDSGTTIAASESTSTATQPQIKVSVKVLDSTNKQIYSDATTGSSLNLQVGQNYSLILTPSSTPPPGAAYSLMLTQTDVPSMPTTSVSLAAGSNSFSVPAQGDYSLKLVVSAPGMITINKYYNAYVACSSPTFTAASLNASAISAAKVSNNIYTYSVSGVISGANGMSPYECALDPTGTGIVDTVFQPCGNAFSNIYSNLVSSRKVSVLVKDACNTVYTVSNTVNLPYTEPAMGVGNVFIFGQTSNPTGSAVGDSRIAGVTYLATNINGHNIVQPNYNSGTFSITAAQNYGMPSSVNFGMGIVVQGITGTLDLATGTGSLSASGASLKSVTYSTDQAGDTSTPMAFSSSNCTLSNQKVAVKFVSGQPCTSGTTGDQNGATVEVWGHYVCSSLSTSGATISVSGDFDGLSKLVDSCSGGGGGGGGIVPIQL